MSSASTNSLAPASTNYKVLYSFRGRYEFDGSNPVTNLLERNGTIYGTTSTGGVDDLGTFFSLSASGKERVLHSFGAGHDGSPPSGLIAVGTMLYGTSFGERGCARSCGMVFRLETSGVEHVLYRFKGAPDGKGPGAPLIALNGRLYGTTEGGGTGCASFGLRGCGTVFEITLSGNERVIYRFHGDDGASPMAALFAHGGMLYGTTEYGGAVSKFCVDGCGTVFEVSTSGRERILHRFRPYPDGAIPLSSLVFTNGRFYGTTQAGGAKMKGTVFEVSPAGHERVLYSFSTSGAVPQSGLILVSGTLYGTTSVGGASRFGAVFEMSLTGQEHTLHAFRGYPDGSEPYGPLMFSNGKLYGTTYIGGSFDRGAVFEVAP